MQAEWARLACRALTAMDCHYTSAVGSVDTPHRLHNSMIRLAQHVRASIWSPSGLTGRAMSSSATSGAFWQHVPQGPPDAILGLTEAFKNVCAPARRVRARAPLLVVMSSSACRTGPREGEGEPRRRRLP